MVFITAFFFSHHTTLCLILQWQKGPVYFEDIYVNILFACEMRDAAPLQRSFKLLHPFIQASVSEQGNFFTFLL